ncbi:MAG TPA: GNAT family N-acetyltransferase [Bryobacteraceae bacterium]|nr:GNAT family N-acetyltransferase [Bryobacteraceae bacterium]
MAARLEASPPAREILDLRQLSARDLEPLLEEETAVWREELDWDFEKSADLVRRFVDLRALNGCALIERGVVTGYVYYVLEENKGLIGDLYVRQAARTPAREDWLLEAALDQIAALPQPVRIECQLMMLGPGHDQGAPYAAWRSSFERNFMRIDLRKAALGAGRPRRPIHIERWADHYQDAAAQLIAEAYRGHIDSRINDQYRSAAGARRFLYNIVQYPGCGAFHRPASFAAFEADSGYLCGISLASLVAADCGHITQLCVSDAVRGAGAGYELLRRSLTVLRSAGCSFASLTVTAANRSAVALYERVGFETTRRFPAFVWEGLGGAKPRAVL